MRGREVRGVAHKAPFLENEKVVLDGNYEDVFTSTKKPSQNWRLSKLSGAPAFSAMLLLREHRLLSRLLIVLYVRLTSNTI